MTGWNVKLACQHMSEVPGEGPELKSTGMLAGAFWSEYSIEGKSYIKPVI